MLIDLNAKIKAPPSPPKKNNNNNNNNNNNTITAQKNKVFHYGYRHNL